MNELCLDVGCGSVPKGDINTDLYIEVSPHHKGFINPLEITNFVISDAHYLPFRDKVFEKVICSHVLEHLLIPNYVIKELSRICYEIVLLSIPNDPKTTDHREHLYSWSQRSLENLLKKYFIDVKVLGFTRIGDMSSSRLLKFIGKINTRFPAFGRPMLRALCNFSKLELHAVCKNAKV